MHEIDRELFDIYPVPSGRLADLPVTDDTRTILNRVIREYKQRSTLRKHGLANANTIFLCGPPGTGKAMTIRALAHETKLQIYEARPYGSCKGMAQQICFNRGVFLFHDTVPVRLFKQLKLATPYGMDSLVVVKATSSVNCTLDVLEQFDERIRYRYPTKNEIAHIVRNCFALWDVTDEMLEMVTLNSDNLSHMEIMRVCDNVLKDKIMSGADNIDTRVLHTALKTYQGSKWWKRNDTE